MLYSFYRKLTSEETRKSISLNNKNCQNFLKSSMESDDENMDILQQLSGTKCLGDGETLLLRNLEKAILEPVPEELSLVPIDKNNEAEHCFGYNYTNVFNKVLSKHDKYCCFSFKYNHIRKENSRKKSTPKFEIKAKSTKSGCPVSATIQKFDNSEFMNINLRGDIVHPIGKYKSRRRIDDKKKVLDSVFEAHPNARPSTIFKKRLEAIDGDSFGAGNLTVAGVTPNSIHVAASRVRSKHNSMEGIHDNVLKL